jgi:hypothetical protein
MSQEPSATKTKKSYERPRLTAYGKLRDLTTGGTGNANEGSSGQRPRP